MDRTMEIRRLLFAAAAAALLAVGMVGLSACGGGNASTSTSASESTTANDDASSEFADLEPVTLVYADITGMTTAAHQWGEGIVDRAAELTDGKLIIDYHPAGELGGGSDIMRLVQSNDIQLFYMEPSTISAFIPAMEAFAAPMLFQGYTGDQIETVLNGDNQFTRDLQAACEEAKVRNMGFLQDATYRQTTSNKALNTLEDYKGLQIRTLDDVYHMAFWQALGAEPTPLAFAELYFALQNGTLEAEENGLDTFVGNSLQEVQKYVCFTNHILYSGIIVMNNECWNSLDPAYQKALTQAIEETRAEIRATLPDVTAESLEIMKDAGMEVIEYDDEFFETIKSDPDVQKIYSDLDEYTGGLVTELQNELDKVSK